jgi:hypothetical protein
MKKDPDALSVNLNISGKSEELNGESSNKSFSDDDDDDEDSEINSNNSELLPIFVKKVMLIVMSFEGE